VQDLFEHASGSQAPAVCCTREFIIFSLCYSQGSVSKVVEQAVLDEAIDPDSRHGRILLVGNEDSHDSGLQGRLGDCQLAEDVSDKGHVAQAVCGASAAQLVPSTVSVNGARNPDVAGPGTKGGPRQVQKPTTGLCTHFSS